MTIEIKAPQLGAYIIVVNTETDFSLYCESYEQNKEGGVTEN